jgi:SET family sugar efflux transporter-like MFS transporter
LGLHLFTVQTLPTVSSAIGGVIARLGVDLLGLPHVFLAPVLHGLVATAIAVMSRSRHAVG